MQTYHFYAVNKDGSYTTIAGYGNTKEEGFNNTLEKTPEETTLKEDKPKAKITPSVKPIPYLLFFSGRPTAHKSKR